MLKIIWSNTGGQLDIRIVEKPSDVGEAITDMVESVDEIFPGDSFRVVELSEAAHRAEITGDPLVELVERVHEPAPTDAIERYKGFVIRKPADAAGFMWEHGDDSVFLNVERVRADIDLYLARVDIAGASR